MDNSKRAENIFTLLNLPAKYDPKNGIPKGSYDAVLAELDEAQLEVLEQNEVLVKIRIDEAVREAHEMKLHSMAKECQIWYERGSASARENAAEIIENEEWYCGGCKQKSLIGLMKIRALSPEK